MNATDFARQVSPLLAFGAVSLAAPASSRRAPSFCVLQGVGREAQYLSSVWVNLTGGQTAAQLGWQVPPAARIVTVLAGVRDADWSLEPDEMAF